MEQLRRGVAAPELHLVPPRPDAESAAALKDRLEEAGRQLAALPDAVHRDHPAAPPATRPATSCARRGGSGSSTRCSSTCCPPLACSP
ncbi:hypothetical protein ACFU9B_44550 [Streptomyces sp. NPDC057592]|uniref:hypothetical protein n=1 Tax=unclassified Streptomyces TaxID=2593676 RepID=UPI00367A8F20